MLIKIFQTLFLISAIAGMLPEEKSRLRSQVIEMFKHGFGSYMVENALFYFVLFNSIMFFL
jgi:hypothetical protein